MDLITLNELWEISVPFASDNEFAPGERAVLSKEDPRYAVLNRGRI